MAKKLQKGKVLYIGPNRRAEWRPVLFDGMCAIDKANDVGWELLPQYLLPIRKNNRLLREAMVVTERSNIPVDPTGFKDSHITKKDRCLLKIANLRNSKKGSFDAEGGNWIVLSILLLCAVVGVVVLVALVTSDHEGLNFF